ncbi:protein TRIGALACTOSYLDIACYLGLYCEROL 3, chloroplastic isoform X2 [Solanum dulcamara]|uniref:protein TRIGALACTOSYLDIACYLGLYCEROL 3, chloroplastic isoform X2 n=1 Tax=Solanum dulcamara TaxID=45834 RepID=UPI0024863F79|nr:protein TRIGALACTOSYLDIACYLGLYCEROL 3, chloroplastic isoform X2 [Solanum dulcamara]
MRFSLHLGDYLRHFLYQGASRATSCLSSFSLRVTNIISPISPKFILGIRSISWFLSPISIWVSARISHLNFSKVGFVWRNSMVSFVGSVMSPAVNICKSSSGPSSSSSSSYMKTFSPNSDLGKPFLVRSLTNRKDKWTVCACVAPPRDYKTADSDRFPNTRFNIRHGEAVGIIGPSGTGKSTILKIMAGLLAPDKGEVLIRGKLRNGLVSDEEISGLRIGLVFQSAALFDSLTVRENVGFLLYENSAMPEDQIAQLVTETLAAVGLKEVEDRLPSELSGGMKKRVALARSIIFDTTKDIVEPEVLLYDEPTAGLDPIASTVVEDLIRSVHAAGEDALGKPGKIASYVVVTHQHSTIKRAVDRLIFLYEGKVVWQGMTHEFSTSANPIVRQFASGSLDGPIRY